MSHEKSAAELQAINKQQLFGADTSQNLPQITLANGTKVQTGTIGALMHNIRLYDRVIAGETLKDGPNRETLEHMLVVPIATLQKVGMFELFPVEEWLAASSAGRRYVGSKAKEMGL